MTDEPLAWTIVPAHLGRNRLVILAVALVALALGWVAFGRPILGLLGLLLILGSTADHLLPSTFTLDAKGATAKNGASVTAMEWGAVRRVLSRGAEIRLSPLEKPSKILDATRGVGLVPTPENRQRVLAYVERHLQERGRPVR